MAHEDRSSSRVGIVGGVGDSFLRVRWGAACTARGDAGYRDYDETDIEVMRFVRRLRALELPLDDIREIVRLRTSGEAPCRPVRDAIARESEAVDDRIAELSRLRTELRSLQQRMDATVDQWPEACVCHVIEET